MRTKTLRTVTVADLIALLEGEDPNAQVIFSTNYGDYHRTPQALPLTGEVEEVSVTESAYSNSGFALVEDDEDDEDDEDIPTATTFLLIR